MKQKEGHVKLIIKSIINFKINSFKTYTFTISIITVIVITTLTSCNTKVLTAKSTAPNVNMTIETEKVKEQSGSEKTIPNVENYFKAIPFSSDKYLSDEEFVIAGEVKLGMSYEEALKILGRYDEAYDNAPGVKSITKGGFHYGFYQINETFINQSDLKIDGVFRLLDVSLTKSSNDEFPRGIKIGDSIENVLNKFPGKDKELRKWAYQNIYGKDEIGKPRARLEFTMYNECYRLVATTTKQVLIVQFDRKNNVSSIELHKEDS